MMKIKHIRSKEYGNTPSNLEHGEIAINYNDKSPKLFIKTDENVVEEFSSDKEIKGYIDNNIDALAENLENAIICQETNDVLDEVDTIKFLKYVEQYLTEEEKKQSRTNIGATDEEWVISQGYLTEQDINHLAAKDDVSSLKITVEGEIDSIEGEIDSIQENVTNLTDGLNIVSAVMHSHENKLVIDNIDDDDITRWNSTQPNIIESISVNNTPLTISDDKNVNIDLAYIEDQLSALTLNVENIELTPGPQGIGITSIDRTNGNGAAGTTDTYTITYSDDSKSTFKVYNGRNGADGKNGVTPEFISINANADSGTGVPYVSVISAKTNDDKYTLLFNFQNIKGVGITSVDRTNGNGAAGTTDVYTITYSDGTKSTFNVYNGNDGQDGANGNMWHVGTGVPLTTLGVAGDLYLEGIVGTVYQKRDGDYWLPTDCNLRGNDGKDGTNGAKWYNGTTSPDETIGANGDWYVNTSTWDVFYKESNNWVKKGCIKGETGSFENIDLNDYAKTTDVNKKQDAISDLATIRSNASSGATAYGWGDHSKKGYLTSSALSGYAKEDWVTSYVVSAVTGGQVSLDGYATEEWVTNKGYLTEHQDISNLATKSEVEALTADVVESEYVMATALNKVIVSAGFDVNGMSTLPSGETLTNAIKRIDSITSSKTKTWDYTANDYLSKSSGGTVNGRLFIKTSAENLVLKSTINPAMGIINADSDALIIQAKSDYGTSYVAISPLSIDGESCTVNKPAIRVTKSASGLVCTNLNADLLDGKHASDFVLQEDIVYYANVQPDWNESSTSSDAYIKNKPSLAAVATSGNFYDLTLRPELFSGDYNDLTNKPTIPSVDGFIKNISLTTSTETLYIVGSTSKTGSTTSLNTSSTDVYISGGEVYAASDERLKDFGDNVEVDFNELSEIPKVYYSWKDDEEKRQMIGTSAQKLKEIYPELVSENEDGKMAVSYEKLSIIALAAVDKLHKENEELKDRLKRIEEKLGL